MLVNVYFFFYVKTALRENWSDNQYKTIRIINYYIYDFSIRNIRIEGLWRQQRYTTTSK
jgi:hypothetical protein